MVEAPARGTVWFRRGHRNGGVGEAGKVSRQGTGSGDAHGVVTAALATDTDHPPSMSHPIGPS